MLTCGGYGAIASRRNETRRCEFSNGSDITRVYRQTTKHKLVRMTSNLWSRRPRRRTLAICCCPTEVLTNCSRHKMLPIISHFAHREILCTRRKSAFYTSLETIRCSCNASLSPKSILWQCLLLSIVFFIYRTFARIGRFLQVMSVIPMRACSRHSTSAFERKEDER